MSRSSETRAQVGLWTIFFVNGAVLANWAPRIPQVAAEVGADDSMLGVAIFGLAAGSVPAIFATGRLIRHVAAHHVSGVAALAFAASLPLIALAHDATSLTLVLVAIGACAGCLDVAMNAAALQLERARRRRMLSRLHGGYSLGVLGGASFGALASHLELPVRDHFLAAAVCLTALVALSSRWLSEIGPRSPNMPVAARQPASIGIPVAALAVASLLMEGTITDWSALIISRDLAGGPTLGALGVVAFSVAMFASRSWGDPLITRLGTSTACALSGSITVCAIGTALAVSEPVSMTIACAVVGLALGPLFPLSISLAGRRNPESAGVAAARVSAIGYVSYLAGPPLVGAMAGAMTLPLAIGVAVVAAAGTIATAGRRV